jgi:decaprenyl-phosphate phosphoribosyltransferase
VGRGATQIETFKSNKILENILVYINIARPSHWTKHIFIIPGVVFAALIVGTEDSITNKAVAMNVALGFASASLIASANYVINEFLDAKFDQFHPLKKNRPGTSGKLDAKIVLAEYILLSAIGLASAFIINKIFFYVSVLFLISGILYNVSPIRLKDRVFIDVLSEALNNPIRLILGWTMIAQTTLPPLSILISYWFGGAFLMAVKRLAEYRFIGKTKSNKEQLGKYRASFRKYTEQSILLSALFYQVLAVFFGAVFLVKYRAEYIIIFPCLAILITYYMKLGLAETSITQTPEKLYKDRWLITIVIITVMLFAISTLVDIQFLQWIVNSNYATLHFSE